MQPFCLWRDWLLLGMESSKRNSAGKKEIYGTRETMNEEARDAHNKIRSRDASEGELFVTTSFFSISF